MKFKITLLVIVLIFGIDVFGQTGSILVTAIDDQTGETLIGATAMLEGTTFGALTDFDGNATFSKIPVGTYNIKVSYISYQTTVISDVKVEQGRYTDYKVHLKSSELKLDEVVITAKQVRNNENAILTVQKKSPKLFDAITSDQFSVIGASDAASALKKVTGVTVTDGKYVFVRGLGDRYSKSTLNGSDIPSLDPNKNSVQLDMFPSSLVDNIIVYKTFTPDLSGDFAGGIVDITTKDFPESFNLNVSVGFEYNEKSNLNGNFLVAEGSSTDIWGYDNGFRALPDEIKNYNRDYFLYPYTDPVGITAVSRAFKNRQFQPTKEAQLLNHSLNFSLGNQVSLFNRQLGLVFGMSYNRAFSNYTDGVQNIYVGVSPGQTTLNNDILSSTLEQRSTDEAAIGALFNATYKLNHLNKIGVSVLANQSGTNEIRLRDGYNFESNTDSTDRVQNRGINYTDRSIINGQVRGEHVLNILNRMTIKWSNSYTISTFGQPDLRLLRNGYSITDDGDSVFFVGNNEKPYRFFRDLNEMNNDSKIDFILPVTLFNGLKSKIKFGGTYIYKERSFRERAYYYNINYNKSYNGNVSVFFTDENLGYVNGELRNYLFIDDSAPNNYDADQHLSAAYAMIESPITKDISITTGVRLEKTDMSLRAFDGTTGKIEIKDLLPSFAFTYNLTEKTNIRASANRTLARPTFREFAPLATFDLLGGYIQNGNPDLTSTTINNFDIRIEQFPNIGEYLAISLFYKQFHDPIENAQDITAGGSGKQFRYRNVDKATLYGAELEVRKYLGVEGLLKHLKTSANFSYIHAFVDITAEELYGIRKWNPGASDTRPMYNQAPFSLNTSIAYENTEKHWESSLNFNVSGKRLIVYQVDLPSIYLKPMPDLNFTFKKGFSNHYSVRFRMKNILNNTYSEEMKLDGNAFMRTKYQLGRSYSLSLSYDF